MNPRVHRRSCSRSHPTRLLLAVVAVTVVGLGTLGLVAGVDGSGGSGSSDGPARLGVAEIPTGLDGSSGPLAASGTAGSSTAATGTAGSSTAAPGAAAGAAASGAAGADSEQGTAGGTEQGTAGGGQATGATGGWEPQIPGSGVAGAVPAAPGSAATSTPQPAVERAMTPSKSASTSSAPVSGGDDGAGLLWSDEFGGVAGAAPDPDTWITQTGSGWGDREMQCYTRDPRNLATDGRGHLVITARREPSCDGTRFSSARIETLGKRAMRYGYLETRAVLPTGRGAFPAVWLLGSDMPAVGWPASGELDVVEAVSTAPTTVHTNVHGVDTAGAHWQATWGNGGMYDAGADLAAAFHTYGLEWTPCALRFYFDGRLIRTVTRDQVPVWLWDREHYVILNVAVNSEGASATAADYPQRMAVDYLRVYVAKP
ncbi:family 16 glycosylhydrolase [Frankia sp. Mgl5]|uniref:family 16 glycosylhydrolase n=1 Tax=Frankia sp. Mgl5 TaxID=2933793 RepID=UPI00200C1CA1|nr:family 16 glycosylhydrolase [Frankia sp. Mgl5]MCK9927834.1 family 16 glycosylhydrolase [Frankia sp. Mgl5]